METVQDFDVINARWGVGFRGRIYWDWFFGKEFSSQWTWCMGIFFFILFYSMVLKLAKLEVYFRV